MNNAEESSLASTCEIKISKETLEKAKIAKNYIESKIKLTKDKYKKNIDEEREKKQWWEGLVKKMQNLNLSTDEQHVIKKEVLQKESEMIRRM